MRSLNLSVNLCSGRARGAYRAASEVRAPPLPPKRALPNLPPPCHAHPGKVAGWSRASGNLGLTAEVAVRAAITRSLAGARFSSFCMPWGLKSRSPGVGCPMPSIDWLAANTGRLVKTLQAPRIIGSRVATFRKSSPYHFTCWAPEVEREARLAGSTRQHTQARRLRPPEDAAAWQPPTGSGRPPGRHMRGRLWRVSCCSARCTEAWMATAKHPRICAKAAGWRGIRG